MSASCKISLYLKMLSSFMPQGGASPLFSTHQLNQQVVNFKFILLSILILNN